MREKIEQFSSQVYSFPLLLFYHVSNSVRKHSFQVYENEDHFIALMKDIGALFWNRMILEMHNHH